MYGWPNLTAATLSLPSPAMDAIVVDGLEKTYGKDIRALDGIRFSVREGEVYGLLGPNGAGKSTTVRILVTLSKPDAGSATVAGFDVVREAARVRGSIGYVAQKQGVDPAATARENLLLQGRVQGLGGGELERRVDDLLDRFTLGEKRDALARTMSGGQQRRLDVALGLVHRPHVLFLDEPTTGLDPEARAAMWEELERLAADERLTILLTTHYLEEADRLAERVGIVSRGRLVVEGTPDELKRQLRGEAVTVELADGNGAGPGAVAIVEGLGDVYEVMLDGRHLRARVANGAAAVPAILSALDGGGVPVAAVTMARPSLDDVYLHYTGRDFRSEDEEGRA